MNLPIENLDKSIKKTVVNMRNMQIVLESAEDTFQLPHYPIECYRCDTRKYGEPTLLHWHTCCEMVFMHHGEQQVTIGETSFTLRPGDMVYIHPRQVHEFVSRSDFCDFTLLKFNTSLLFSREEYEPELQYMRPFLEESGYRCLVFSHVLKKAAPLLEALLREEKQRAFGFETRMRNLICMLAARLVDESSLAVPSTKRQKEFDRLLQYLSAHFQEDDLMEKALEICNLSYSNFAAKFKRTFGTTFTAYLNHVRIANARRLLLNSSDSIASIAEACGYHDAGYFSRIFHKIAGISPSEFRTEHYEV